jgi:hypothetical protein
MARFNLGLWFQGMAGSWRRRRRLAAVPARPRWRLLLEALEDRCVPSTVTNLTAHDPGSLRDAILSTATGD